jgi:hypothetical protein
MHASTFGSFGVIPPAIWSTFNADPCCAACWDVHRSFGLPRAFDYACCAGSCGPDPRGGAELPQWALSPMAANVLALSLGALVVAGVAQGVRRTRSRSRRR